MYLGAFMNTEEVNMNPIRGLPQYFVWTRKLKLSSLLGSLSNAISLVQNLTIIVS